MLRLLLPLLAALAFFAESATAATVRHVFGYGSVGEYRSSKRDDVRARLPTTRLSQRDHLAEQCDATSAYVRERHESTVRESDPR